MELQILIILHVIGATLWVGPRVFLALRVLPNALKEKSSDLLKKVVKLYTPIGHTAVLIQILTGIRMAMIYAPASEWFNFDNPHSKLIVYKFFLLFITLIVSFGIEMRVIKNLNDDNLSSATFPLVISAVIGILFVLTGLSFKYFII